ncbi:LPXTG cell wall anchor domain-containing protein, partial [Streptococcus sanguinis]
TYTVEEVNVPDGYIASVEGYNITNTHTPEKPTPGKPNEPGKPKKGGELPNTGSESNQAALVGGISLLGLGTGFLARRKKED